MSFKNLSLPELINYCKEYGFIFQSSEIYDGMQAIYDYGHYGCLLKQNVKHLWQREMIQKHNNIVGIDSAIIMHPNIWKASGHVDNFDDLMIDNKDSKKRYRVDILIEEFAEKHNKPAIVDLMNSYIKEENLDGLYDIIKENNICCPVSGTCNWTSVRHFNLMFNFKDLDDNTIYLRPETAQGIYVNFLNIQRSTRQKLPFGIAQIGKAFRNEIIARQFTFRMREFEQMEMQFFIHPGED
jgi:glycyl-tRNA synthetase